MTNNLKHWQSIFIKTTQLCRAVFSEFVKWVGYLFCSSPAFHIDKKAKLNGCPLLCSRCFRLSSLSKFLISFFLFSLLSALNLIYFFTPRCVSIVSYQHWRGFCDANFHQFALWLPQPIHFFFSAVNFRQKEVVADWQSTGNSDDNVTGRSYFGHRNLRLHRWNCREIPQTWLRIKLDPRQLRVVKFTFVFAKRS